MKCGARASSVGKSDEFAAPPRFGSGRTDDTRHECSLYAARSQPYYLDITHPNADKGSVVRRLSQMLDIPLDQVATIGDMPNDISMFQTSGFSIAMG